MIEKFDVFEDTENHCIQLRTKSEIFELEFDNPEKKDTFLKIISLFTKEPQISLKKIIKKFSTAKEPIVLEILNMLNEYNLLHFSISTQLTGKEQDKASFISSGLQEKEITIFGEGEFSEILFNSTKKQEFGKVNHFKYSTLKEVEEINKIVEKSDFLLVDANRWSPYHVEQINKIALEHNKPWLFIGGLEGSLLKIGPFFYGKETGCYNCLVSRIKSNHEFPEHFTAYENYLRNAKIGSKADRFVDIDLVYNLTANLALLEVMKFFKEWAIPATWRAYLVLNIASLQLTKHTLLKKPFCEVCKPELEYNPAPWLEAVTLK